MKSATILLSLVALGGVLQGCERAVSYQTDVNPLIQKYCVSCHAPEKDGYNVSGLSMTDHQALMKGTKFGPVVIPGDSFTSVMVMLVEGRADPSITPPVFQRTPCRSAPRGIDRQARGAGSRGQRKKIRGGGNRLPGQFSGLIGGGFPAINGSATWQHAPRRPAAPGSLLQLGVDQAVDLVLGQRLAIGHVGQVRTRLQEVPIGTRRISDHGSVGILSPVDKVELERFLPPRAPTCWR